MNTSIKTHILLALSVASVIAGCQGVYASSSFSEGDDLRHDMSASQVETPLQTSIALELKEVEYIDPLSDIYSELTQSQDQFYQYLRNEPDFKQQWSLEQIQVLQVQRMAKSNSQVLVAVLDTGIDSHHEDLFGRVFAEINFTDSATANDIYGHGTHIGGIIAANNDNSLGIIGLATESRLLNIKVVDDKGRYQISELADGIIWAVNNGAKVINISIVSKEPGSELKEAVDYAWNKGAIVIAAAGNDGSERPVYPAAYENCVAVTAIQENGNLVPLANYGDWVDVAAPGFNIYSTLPSNNYGYRHGTSFAAAYVSGLAALLFPIVTDTNGDGRLNDEVRQAIEGDYRDTRMQPWPAPIKGTTL